MAWSRGRLPSREDKIRLTTYDNGTQSGEIIIDWSKGGRQILTIDGPSVLSFSNPPPNLSDLTLYAQMDGATTHPVMWPVEDVLITPLPDELTAGRVWEFKIRYITDSVEAGSSYDPMWQSDIAPMGQSYSLKIQDSVRSHWYTTDGGHMVSRGSTTVPTSRPMLAGWDSTSAGAVDGTWTNADDNVGSDIWHDTITGKVWLLGTKNSEETATNLMLTAIPYIISSNTWGAVVDDAVGVDNEATQDPTSGYLMRGVAWLPDGSGAVAVFDDTHFNQKIAYWSFNGAAFGTPSESTTTWHFNGSYEGIAWIKFTPDGDLLLGHHDSSASPYYYAINPATLATIDSEDLTGTPYTGSTNAFGVSPTGSYIVSRGYSHFTELPWNGTVFGTASYTSLDVDDDQNMGIYWEPSGDTIVIGGVAYIWNDSTGVGSKVTNGGPPAQTGFIDDPYTISPNNEYISYGASSTRYYIRLPVRSTRSYSGSLVADDPGWSVSWTATTYTNTQYFPLGDYAGGPTSASLTLAYEMTLNTNASLYAVRGVSEATSNNGNVAILVNGSIILSISHNWSTGYYASTYGIELEEGDVVTVRAAATQAYLTRWTLSFR